MAEVKGGSPLTVAGMLDRAEPSPHGTAPPPGALEPHRPRCFVVAAAPEDLCLWCQSVQSLRILREMPELSSFGAWNAPDPDLNDHPGFYRVFMYFLYCYYNVSIHWVQGAEILAASVLLEMCESSHQHFEDWCWSARAGPGKCSVGLRMSMLSVGMLWQLAYLDVLRFMSFPWYQILIGDFRHVWLSIPNWLSLIPNYGLYTLHLHIST